MTHKRTITLTAPNDDPNDDPADLTPEELRAMQQHANRVAEAAWERDPEACLQVAREMEACEEALRGDIHAGLYDDEPFTDEPSPEAIRRAMARPRDPSA